MNGVHNHNIDKPFPGCLGRMVNLFDFNARVAGNGLLTDKPHSNGSSQTRRSLPHVTMLNQFGNHMEDKMIVSESGRNCSKKKSNGTPMKILIAQEMSNELTGRSNPPGVVAKLMGLDTLPQGQTDSAVQRSFSRGCLQSISDQPLSYWHQDKGYWDLKMDHELHEYPHTKEYKDVYEITQQQQKPDCIRDKSPCKARLDEQSNGERIALVCQKFIEAKRLSTDEKLRPSPEFDDTLEVLKSNKDIFLKFLQEPNSLFSETLDDLHSVPSPPETKRITVLKPCKILDDAKYSGMPKKNEKQTKRGSLVNEMIEPQKNHLGLSPPVDWKSDGNPVQPTRIVVLKPTSGKPQDIKAVVPPPSFSPEVFHNAKVEKTEDVEVQKSRGCKKEITGQMCQNISGQRRDETLLSSVFPNGYMGDESSFHKSENEYAAGNLSDAEILSPVSRHSWDYVNSVRSPCSTSSSCRASYSPESSVCREAKKRLSKRWAVLMSSENYQDKRHVGRSSSTLGEMLALSETKSPTIFVNLDNAKDSNDSTLSVTSGSNKDEDIDESPRNLVRSKSVPLSSMVFGTNVDDVDKGIKTNILQEVSQERNVKSSLKVKVSSLFFSRRRKSNKGKPTASQSKDETQPPGIPSESSERADKGRTQCLNHSGYEGCSSAAGFGSSGKEVSPELSAKPCIMSTEMQVGLNVTNPTTHGNASKSQDQRRHISVLEIPFEEDVQTTAEIPANNNPEHGASLVHAKCNLLDKSPSIGSIARTVSWDDSCVDTVTYHPLQTSLSCRARVDEEEEWFSFVQTLLSVVGLNGEIQLDMFMARWYSSESPLDPSLRDKYIDLNEEALHETKRRQRRSTHKLVFDCVNAAIVDMAGYGSETCQRAIPFSGTHKNFSGGGSFIVLNQVWSQMKEWLSGDESCVGDDWEDRNYLVVERVVRKEVAGKGWIEHLRLEMDNIGLGLERGLLDDLLREALLEFTFKP